MIKNRVIRTARTMIVIAICAFLLLSAAVVITGMSDDIHKADVAVVLGNAVNGDGTPSRRLAARLDMAVELYRQGMFENVIVSGGTGPNGISEAEAMKNYLVAHGVAPNSIIVDALGVTTAATAKNAAMIIHRHHWTSVMAISQYFHIPRCRLALSRAGLDQVYSAHARYAELRDLYSIPREVIGYAAYLAGVRD